MAKSLRKKTLVIIGITIVCLIVVLYGVSEVLLLNSFDRLEEQNTRQNVERVTSALSNELSQLDTTTYDWAAWDDTYAFIEDRNEEYIASNLLDGTFTDLELNLMLFVDSSGQIVFGKAFDLETGEEIPLPPSLGEHLASNALLVHHTSTEGSISGIVLLAEDPMLVASRPIITSLDEGPVRGALIMGRYLDAAEVADIAEITQLSLSVHRFDDSQLPSNLQEAKSSLSEDTPVFIQPLSEESIAGYTLLEDIYGNPGLILEVDIPRDIARQGQATLQYLILLILAAGLAFSVVILLSLNRLVLSPLSQLNDSVGGIGASGNLSQRVTIAGRDEIANLAGAINETLASLERSQNELQASEEKYRMLVENANEAIIVAQDGLLKFVNSKAVEISGYSKEELTSRLFVDFIHPDDREMVLKLYLERLKGAEQSTVHSFRVVSKSGDIIWAEISAVLITWAGRPAALNFLSNITERKRAEDVMRENEEKYKTLVENAPFGIYYSDVKGTFLYGNKKAEEIVGYKRDELIGENYLKLKLLDPKGMNKAIKLLALNALGRATGPDEFVLCRKDGSKRSVEIWTQMVTINGKSVVLGMVEDITERNRAVEALRNSSKEHLEVILRTMPFGIFTADLEKRITSWSHGAEILTGLRAEDVIGKTCTEIWNCSACLEKCCLYAESVRKPVYGKECQITLAGRALTASKNVDFLKDKEGHIIGGIETFEDDSERKSAEEAKAEGYWR